jgi:hypothetical protein
MGHRASRRRRSRICYDPDGVETEVLVATKVESENNLVMAVAAKDCGGFECLKGRDRKAKIVAITCVAPQMVIGLVVGVTVAFAAGGTAEKVQEVPQETFFDTIGRGPIDGTVRRGDCVLSVATNRDGSRIAAADLLGVQVLELKDSDDSVWEMLGSNIVGVAANATPLADIASECLQSLV